MLYEIMRHIRNFFPVPGESHDGKFAVKDGTITLSFLKPGQYFLVEGSTFNDGIHLYPDADMADETFTGIITGLAIPQAFLSVVHEIEEWQQESGAVSPYASESFGGYSCSRATNKNGDAVSWKDAFRSRLNTWRKL